MPRLHPRFVTVLGFTFSEKALIYVWCLQVMTAGRWHTVAATAVGVVCWIVYIKLLERHAVVPYVIAKPVANVLSRWMEPPPPVLVAGGAGLFP